MHLFIQGPPASGKTTLIESIIPYLPGARGFYTRQALDEAGCRRGFNLITLSGRQALFADKTYKSEYRVSRYGVDVACFDSLAVEELKNALLSSCRDVVIDEIARMELFSQQFQDLLPVLLDKKRVIATMADEKIPLIAELKKRSDAACFRLTPDTAGLTRETILAALASLPLERLRMLEGYARGAGCSERMMVENASSNLFSVVDKLSLGTRALIIAGKGNNGADVLSCARKLAGRGYRVTVFLICENNPNEECAFQKHMLVDMGIRVQQVRNINEAALIKDACAAQDFILEGIFGIGLRGEVNLFFTSLFDIINASSLPVVSCDIPSGLCADTGTAQGGVIRARHTVTFIAPKQGFFLKEGPAACGALHTVDIGISKEYLEKIGKKN